eukprot:TRINITY_DN3211_c0_g1_i2.p1 TRINITY_DN3211_c0_g1~~TRINITY_DN3211_c0_g1_i2.p1  ORF type:complete len:387 (-),score=128.21 TRINITY_DN3211_c0_g1_i2:204-1364(-)
MSHMDPEAEWPTSEEDYDLKSIIGKGAFGKVFRAYCKPFRTECAIKVMELEKINTSIDDIRAEVATMKLCRHPNVLPCHCCFAVKDQLWLVMPLMDQSSCLHIIRLLQKADLFADDQGFHESWIATILKEALQGLSYFHSHGQIHRDLKAGNLLLNSEGSVQIADFGVSGWLQDVVSRKTRTTFVGTPNWMAPEILEQSCGYDSKADIWSLGITALELARGRAPYAEQSPMRVLMLTLQKPPPSLKTYGDSGPKFSTHFHDFVKQCLQKDPEKRPTSAKLLNHSFIKKSKPCETLVKDLVSLISMAKCTVGESSGTTMSGSAASSIPQTSLKPSTSIDSSEKYVPGTTWVFPSEECVDDDDDDLEEFAAAIGEEDHISEEDDDEFI